MTTYGFIITRSDAYDTSYEVWARSGVGPLEYGDGIYVGNFPILPSEDSIVGTWDAPASGTWVFTATQVQRGVIGATSLPETAV
jgi:hypothetical protein